MALHLRTRYFPPWKVKQGVPRSGVTSAAAGSPLVKGARQVLAKCERDVTWGVPSFRVSFSS